MTDHDHLVTFELAPKVPVETSWPTAEGGNAWLAMDRDRDGKITSGAELFGDRTPQSAPRGQKNGFRALADLDLNHDGVLDSRDPDFARLLLWHDQNMNGISEPGELIFFGSVFRSIEVDAKESNRTDPSGNQFVLRSKVCRNDHNGTEWVWDVAPYWVEIPEPAQ